MRRSQLFLGAFSNALFVYVKMKRKNTIVYYRMQGLDSYSLRIRIFVFFQEITNFLMLVFPIRRRSESLIRASTQCVLLHTTTYERCSTYVDAIFVSYSYSSQPYRDEYSRFRKKERIRNESYRYTEHRSGMAEPRVVRALLEKAYCQTDPAVRFLEIFCSIIRLLSEKAVLY